MIPNSKWYKAWYLLAVISLLIIGCAPSPEEVLEHVNTSTQKSEIKAPSKPAVEEPANDGLTVTPSTKSGQVVNPKTETTHEDVIVADKEKSKNDSDEAKVYNVTEDYDPSNPTLMGFSTNASMDQVVNRFGNPLNNSIMDDGIQPLQIYEYPGFIFGFNSSKQVQFIEVNSSEINPGLNDLHIGQSVEDARDALGTPESLNEYVMIYASNDLIMKLDLDPHSNIIRSIKLFAE